MRSLDTINEYVKLVCHQIRWKKSHERISEEVSNHIIDGRDAYIKQGLDEQEATIKAIAESGDALVIGTQLDRIHRPKPQWAMLLWVAGFLLLGVLFSQITFPGMDFQYIFTRLFWLAIGTAFMLAAYFADFSILGKYPWRIFIALSLLVVVVFFAIPANNQWIRIPYIGTIQLGIMSLVFPVILASVIYTARNKGYKGLIISLLVYAFFCLAVIATPPPGLTAFMHFAPVGILLFIFAIMRGWFGVSKLKGSLLVVLPHVGIFALWLLVNIQSGGSFVFHRLIAIINPNTDPLGRGFFPVQIRRLLSNAVLLGEGTHDHWYDRFWPMYDMPEMLYTDYLLATVIFRFGWLAFVAIMCALIFFISKAVTHCFKQKSSLGFFVSTAIIMTFAMQVLTYVAFNLGFGVMFISLPLISSGNTSIVINMILIGFMLSVFRTGDAIEDKSIAPSPRQNDIFTWHDGKLTIDFKMKAE